MGVLVAGIICLVAGFLLAIPILWTIGIVVLVIGLILLLVGSVGGRGNYYYGRWW